MWSCLKQTKKYAIFSGDFAFSNICSDATLLVVAGMCWILCLGLCCWFQFLNGIGSVTWPYSWAHRPPQPFFHLRIMGLYYSPILPTVTLYSVFSMPFSLSHNRFLSRTGRNHGPTCGQSLPTLTLGFAWWLTVAGSSAATVTQTRCPPSLALLFPADLEVQGSIKINPSHLWGTISK